MKGKKIILGISGSIAAYKIAQLIRLYVKAGAEVKVIMTSAATDFITPLTLSTLSKNPVLLDVSDGNTWSNHVELGLWADLMIIAPATANTMAKLASGLSDNMLVATYLSAKCPVWIAPAMDLDMWKHPSTTSNVSILKKYGNRIIPVGHGELASGLIGDGRMAEVEEIFNLTFKYFQRGQELSHITAVVTAGPTKEKIDPVRFISNPSSGKMGIAVARSLASRGARVHLVIGPTSEELTDADITIHQVISAHDMHEVVESLKEDSNLFVFAAAVADYTPKKIHSKKIKKTKSPLSIPLVRTVDIAATISQAKKKDQTTVGFALETNDAEKNALRKLKRKKFDFIVLNSLQDKGAGFQGDKNKITIYDNQGRKKTFGLKNKQKVANDIVDYFVKHYTS